MRIEAKVTKCRVLTLTETADLAQRMCAIDPSWRLVREHGELVLYGNDMPAAWITDESCLDWLKHMERDKRNRLKQQEKRRAAKARKAMQRAA